MRKLNLKNTALLDREALNALGKEVRIKQPLAGHALIKPRPRGFSSVALLEKSNHDRLQDLIPIRYGRMLVSPFSFLRGSAALMADDFFSAYKPLSHNDFNFDLGHLNSHLYFSTFEVGLPTLLRYADRNSMAHSREVRLPFLSHELVEFVFSLPSEFKIKDGWTKFLMRTAFEDLLPEEIAWRKDKIGFEPPQKSWMDNQATQERIKASREILSKEGILKKGAENFPIESQMAHTRGDGSWNHLMVANLF